MLCALFYFGSCNILIMDKPDYPARLSRLRDTFLEKGLDGVVANSLKDVYYYTGKAVTKGDFGFLVVTKKASTLYVTTLDNGLDGPGVRIIDDLKTIRGDLKSMGRLGYDEKNMSVMLFRKLRTGTWSPFMKTLKSLRMVKDKFEISQIKGACQDTMTALKSLKLQGRAEFDVATDIFCSIRSMGDTIAFEPVVASGRNSSNVHHIAGKSVITGGPVIIDMGACRNMYNSDVTRTFMINPAPAESRMLDDCRRIQDELFSMATPGTPFSDIQKRFESLMKPLGHRVFHSFGHGVGLSVHERPSGKDVLEKGMVLTVEPGIYKKGIGGCRWEDTVLVADKPIRLSC
jgi:Xaa-Pro aminopeptidase